MVEKMEETHGQGRSLNSLSATISTLSGSMAQHLKEREEARVMHRLAVSSNGVGSDSYIDAESERSKLLLFPKPRRLGSPAISEFVKPLRCSKHSQKVWTEGSGSGIMRQIMNEKEQDLMEGRECECIPPCYSGPPPCRTDNPLVHDVQFIHQMQLLSPFSLS